MCFSNFSIIIIIFLVLFMSLLLLLFFLLYLLLLYLSLFLYEVMLVRWARGLRPREPGAETVPAVSGFWGLGFGFRVFRAQGLGFGVFRVLRVQGFQGLGFRV